MIEMTLHSIAKQTDNKVRWDTEIEGTPFELYIPKWRVPEPWPQLIRVKVEDATQQRRPSLSRAAAAAAPDRRKEDIVVGVNKLREHTKTIRYQPEGDASDWEIGEPYIPFSLTQEGKQHLTITVRWES
jgi:hypothetical protein